MTLGSAGIQLGATVALPEPRACSVEELLASELALDLTADSGVPWQVWMERESSRAVLAMAVEVVEMDVLSSRAAGQLLANLYACTHTGLALDALRLAVRIAPTRRGPGGVYWVQQLGDAAAGLHEWRSVNGPRIGTLRDLDGAAAVVAFLTRARRPEVSRHTTTRALFPQVSGRRIANRHLERLILQRPSDIDRIVSYVQERGVDREGREPVDRLGEWLDGDVPAVADGWL